MNTEDSLRLARELGEGLAEKGLMFSCAESCTGGLLAAAMTDIPGSSLWFDRGVVSYSNQAKQELLGVHAETLERFGAVSEETAMEMAAAFWRLLRAAILRSPPQVSPGRAEPFPANPWAWCVSVLPPVLKKA